jgi:hypothetical protein
MMENIIAAKESGVEFDVTEPEEDKTLNFSEDN